MSDSDADWAVNDETVAAFFDRLQDGIFPGKVAEEFLAFRRQCEERERAGRELYGQDYLRKQNLAEAREEACDLAIYPFLDSLQAVREGRDGEDYDLVLTVALHAYRAYAAALMLQAKRGGTP